MRERKIKRTARALLIPIVVVLLAVATAVTGYAAGEIRVREQKMTSNGLTLYMEQSGDEGPVSVRIGSEILEDTAVANVGREYPIVTWLLVDNSVSITSADRTRTKQMLTDLVAGKAVGERFNLCTYDEDLRAIVENSNDYSQLKGAIDGIKYNDQKAYLLDALGHVLEKAGESDEYVRVIVIGDRIESNPNGLTMDELERELEASNIPIYVLGCKTKNNAQELNEMYSLSRLTGASHWTLTELEDPLGVVSAMGDGEIPFRIDVSVPEELKDGTTKGVLLTYADGTTTSAQVVMPFGEIVEPEPSTEPETEPETEPVSEPETEPATEPEPSLKPEDKTNPLLFILIGAGVVLVAAIGFLICFITKKLRERNKIVPVNVGYAETGDTEYFAGMENKGEQTQVLVDGDRKLMLCLTDRSNGMRRMEVPLRGRVSIGRGSSNQIVLDYDRTVSNRHCEIFMGGDMLMIRDLNSSNGTFVDGKKVIDQAELSNGSVLKLGRLELEVEIR